MDTIQLPRLDVCHAKGWTHQINWVEDDKPCFVRVCTKLELHRWTKSLRLLGYTPEIINIEDWYASHQD